MKNARTNIQSQQHRQHTAKRRLPGANTPCSTAASGCCGSSGKRPNCAASRAVTPCHGVRVLAAKVTISIGHRVTNSPPPQLDTSDTRAWAKGEAKKGKMGGESLS